MWNRRVRLKEEGRLPGGREERPRATAARPSSADRPAADGGDEFRQVFDKYVAAKQKAGQSTSNLNYESFRKVLSKQAKQLRSGGYKDVNFGVSMKGGKVSVVAVSLKKSTPVRDSLALDTTHTPFLTGPPGFS
jgi:hypothetical protein